MSGDKAFSKPEEIYSGDKAEFTHHTGLLGPMTLVALGGRVTSPIEAGLLAGGLSGTRYYRVKARAGPGRLDSAWSNIVEVEPPRPLPAPVLEAASAGILSRKLTWTAVDGATGYLLQTSRNEAFSEAEDLYTGPNTEFIESGGGLPWADIAMARGGKGLGLATGKPPFGLSRPLAEFGARYYRVRAKAGLDRRDSPWSNVVRAD